LQFLAGNSPESFADPGGQRQPGRFGRISKRLLLDFLKAQLKVARLCLFGLIRDRPLCFSMSFYTEKKYTDQRTLSYDPVHAYNEYKDGGDLKMVNSDRRCQNATMSDIPGHWLRSAVFPF
jgi:hypothetical protein